MIEHIVGDATRPQIEGNVLLIHIVNNRGGFGKGFAENLAITHPVVKAEYRTWYKSRERAQNTFRLGEVQWVEINDHFYVGNLLAQNGYATPENPVALDYRALERCLRHVGAIARKCGATVVAPRLGAGLAGGDWRAIEELIADTIPDVPVKVYSLN